MRGTPLCPRRRPGRNARNRRLLVALYGVTLIGVGSGPAQAAVDVPTGEATAMRLAERGQLREAAAVWAESARLAAETGDIAAEWRAQLRMAEVALNLGYLTLARSSA